jgi:hypothetical protein
MRHPRGAVKRATGPLKMTLKIAENWSDSNPMETPNSRFTASMEPGLSPGYPGAVQTRPIRDRKLSDSTRIPRKTAVKGAITCVSSKMTNRKNTLWIRRKTQNRPRRTQMAEVVGIGEGVAFSRRVAEGAKPGECGGDVPAFSLAPRSGGPFGSVPAFFQAGFKTASPPRVLWRVSVRSRRCPDR